MVSGDRPVGERRPQRDVAEVPARRAEHPVDPAGVADGARLVEHAEHVEGVETVGRHRDPRALLGVGDGATFQDGGLEPEPGGGECDGRTRDASSHDE